MYMYVIYAIWMYTFRYICRQTCMSLHVYTYTSMNLCMCHTEVFSGQWSLLFMFWALVPPWLSQLSTQVYGLLLSKLTPMIFRRWSNSLPYVLYPLWVIPIQFIPCTIKTMSLIISSCNDNMHFSLNQSNWRNSLTSDNNNR